MDAAAVEKAVAGQDAVISALGPTRPPVPAMMEIAAKNIVAVMKKHGVRRLVSTTGAGVRQPEDEPKLADQLISLLLNVLEKAVDPGFRSRLDRCTFSAIAGRGTYGQIPCWVCRQELEFTALTCRWRGFCFEGIDRNEVAEEATGR
jgi:hypothetical protein